MDRLPRLVPVPWVLAAAAWLIASPAARADPIWFGGNVLVSRSVYQDVGDVANLKVGDPLPGGGNAVADGTYPNVFNNAKVDGSFGVTSPIFIDQFTRGGTLVNTLNVPTSGPNGVATSFPSKSEMALNLATDGQSITFMAYSNPGAGKLDVSNSNTPGVPDSTNPVKGSGFSRAVVQIDALGNVTVTPTNAYSGNNGRAAIYDAAGNQYLMVGNAGNGKGTPDNVVKDTGVQTVAPGQGPNTTVIGQHQGTTNASTGSQYGFSVTQIYGPSAADKSGKDNNYRGETIFNNTLYVSKGSGGNGINTVYQVSVPGGGLPNAANGSLATFGILPGFSRVLANSSTGVLHPFGLWFANATTLYVGDEGDGANVGVDGGGLQKWSLVNGVWQLDYTLTNGLVTGQPYTLGNYPAVTTDGLRNITGFINNDGTVTIYGVTSTVSAAGDQGADPNMVVAITDNLSFTTAAQAAAEQFGVFEGPAYGTVYRGVSPAAVAVPEPSSLVSMLTGLGGGLAAWRWRRRKA
jgi:hypothetical protein